MSDVDPFTIPLPAALGKMPEDWTRDDVAQMQASFEYLWRWCHLMWIRSGGASDSVQEVTNVVTGESETIDGQPPVFDDDWQTFATP